MSQIAAIPSVSSPRPPVRRLRFALAAGAAGLALAAFAAYWPALKAPLVFDDIPAVERNATIRSLWPLWPALQPPADGSGVSGRPMVNLSLAINYAVGGSDARSFHWGNIALHLLAALSLWSLLRRTMRLTGADARAGAGFFAWTAALVWSVHPLLTESVVCVVQRNEIMGSLFYLLTIHCFVCGVDSRRWRAPEAARVEAAETRKHVEVNAPPRVSSRLWSALSVVSCLAGVASKEIVATAPLLVFLYDRTFVAGSFRSAWRQRWRYYLLLAATWLPLAWLVWHNRQRGGTVGFGLSITPWEYLLTQCRALVLYLKLAFWPTPLVLDYGWPVVQHLGDVSGRAVVIVALLAATIVALARRPVIGFLAASCFIILAPSSSFVPLVSQTIAEHRMYLPLAVMVIAALAAAWRWGGARAMLAFSALAIVLGLATRRRCMDYGSEVTIWTDTVAKVPGNARAHGNLGRAYLQLGRWDEAIAACRAELRLAPNYNGDAHANIGRALIALGRPAEAIPELEAAVRGKPEAFDVRNNLGVAFAGVGRWNDAVEQYREALRLQPDFADAHNNLANALSKLGRAAEALDHYAAALRLQTDFTEAETNLARTLAENGRLAEALPHFKHVASRHPDSAEAEADLAQALAASGRAGEAEAHYEAALHLQPGLAPAHYGLGNLLAARGDLGAAVDQFATAVQLDPGLAAAQHNLGAALMQLGRPAEALPHFDATVRLMPASAAAHHELALVLGGLGRWPEAIREDQEALRLQPDLAEAREHLAWLREQR
ncbi:MAG TPA: tetratricopeptide repeat protein [Lacunisphaera sp.]|nr:tetratricopeptide repeat protein [Lacunisphaera sp.]